MSTALSRVRRWSALESHSADEQGFLSDRALADELGIDQASREWQVLASISTFWSKYRNCKGQLYPFFDNETQLDAIRSRCRVVGQVFPVAITAIDALTDYTVGTGYQFKVQSRDGSVSPDFLRECEKIVHEFVDRVDWSCGLDRELFAAARQDGDQAAAVFDLGHGFADVRLVPPEHITEPSNVSQVERWLGVPNGGSWSFGIHSDRYDMQQVYGYYVQWSAEPGDFDYLPAEQVEFIKHNVRRHVKRGLSDFHAVIAWLVRHEKLMRNTAVGSAIQAAIAWVEQYAEGVQQADAESIALGGANYTYTLDSEGGGQTRYATSFEPGSIIGLSKGLTYESGPLGSQRNPNFMLVAQAVARLIGARWSMPEYLISGDASNANYASTMVAESPWVKATLARQAQFGRVQANILYRVLNIALRGKRLSSFQVRNLNDLRSAVNIIATAPGVETRDRLKESQRRELLKRNGILSPDTWSEEEGYDPTEEVRRGAKADEPQAALPGLPNAQQIAEALWSNYP